MAPYCSTLDRRVPIRTSDNCTLDLSAQARHWQYGISTRSRRFRSEERLVEFGQYVPNAHSRDKSSSKRKGENASKVAEKVLLYMSNPQTRQQHPQRAYPQETTYLLQLVARVEDDGW